MYLEKTNLIFATSSRVHLRNERVTLLETVYNFHLKPSLATDNNNDANENNDIRNILYFSYLYLNSQIINKYIYIYMYKRNSNPPTFNPEMARLDSRSAILHNFSTWPSSVSYCQFFLIAQFLVSPQDVLPIHFYTSRRLKREFFLQEAAIMLGRVQWLFIG